MSSTSTFVFRLDPVLEHRRRLEALARRDLAEAQAAVHALRAQLDALSADSRAALDYLRGGRLVGMLDLDYLGHHRRHAADTAGRAAEIMRQLADADRLAADRRDKLAALARESKAVEKLREKRRADFDAAAARREADALDDVGNGDAARRLFARTPGPARGQGPARNKGAA